MTPKTEEGKVYKHLEPFAEPRLMPSKWDMSEMTSSQIGARDSSRQAAPSRHPSPAPADTETHPEKMSISFSEWQHHAYLDAPDHSNDCFAAF